MEKALSAALALGLGTGRNRFPPDLVSLQRAYSGEWRTEIGPEATFAATGPQVDADGNPCAHNYIPNSEGVGGAVGVLPTGGWSISPLVNGITTAVIGAGSGYIYLSVSGTATAQTILNISPHSGTDTNGVIGETFTGSIELTRLTGNYPTVGLGMNLIERTTAGSFVTSLSGYVTANGEKVLTKTLSGATTGKVSILLQMYNIPINEVVNFTIRISHPQLSKSAVKLPYVPTYGSAAFGPSITDKGLWAGGAWTNLAAVVDTTLTGWFKSGCTITEGNKVVPTADSLTHFVSTKEYSFISGTTYHSSVKIKADGYNWVRLSFNATSFPVNERSAFFNVSTGAVGAAEPNTNPKISGPDEDGYYLCSISTAADKTAASYALTVVVTNANGIITIIGDGLSGVRIKDFMLVSGTSYQYPYAPPGITVPAAGASTGGNGTNTPMTPGTWEIVTDGVELCGDPGFAGTSWWLGSGTAGRLISGGVCSFTAASTGVGIYKTFAVTIGERYRITYDIVSLSEGVVEIVAPFGGIDRTTPGTYTEEGIATSTTISIGARTGPLTATIDNISIQRITGSVYVPSKGDKMLEALRGRTDGVELVGTRMSSLAGWDGLGAFTSKELSAGGITVTTSGAGGYRSTNDPLTTTIGARYLFTVKTRVISGAGLAVAWRINDGTNDIYIGDSAGDTNSTTSFVTYTKEITATSTTLYVYFRNGGAGVGEYSIVSIQRLLPSVFTACAAVYVGAGSGELPDAVYNITTPTDSVTYSTSHIQVYGGGLTNINRSHDGTASATRSGTWNRDEIHLKVVQTNALGTQFRVGNRRYSSSMVPIDSLTWGSWAAYDGSMNPLTHLRLALNGTIPLWFRLVSLSKKSLADTEILNQLRFLPRHITPLEMVDSLQMLDTLEMI